MEEADSSQHSRGITPEQDPVPAPETEQNEDQTNERVLGSELMATQVDQLLDQIHGIASPILQFTLKWKDIDENFTTLENLLKERDMEVELKERSVMERTVELEKKGERLKEVEERERKVVLLEKSMALRLEEKENEVKQSLVSSLLKRLDCETANEAANVLEEKGREVERLSKCNEDKDKALKEFDLKQKEWVKQLEAIKEKVIKLEKKEKSFDAEQKAKAVEMELKCKEKWSELEKKEKRFEVELKAKDEEMKAKEKQLEEREKELALKQRELEQVMDKLKERELQERAETRKRRSCVHVLAEKGTEASRDSHRHEDTDKETNSACAGSDKAYEEKIDESSPQPEEIKIVDSEFHDFKKTMSSFVVNTIWALYDAKDDMPRCYARIKRINKSRLCLDVTWLDPKDDESVPAACGKFTYGRTETVSHLTLSHELKPIRHARGIIVNPKEGETWAVFRDWSQSWENNPGQHKPPYRYDLVEVVVGFEDHQGVGVKYLGKVEGFVSVFEHAAQHEVLQQLIGPDEMHMFSHSVPSVRQVEKRKREFLLVRLS